MPNGQPANNKNPFRVFISHKIDVHGKFAEQVKDKLENYARETLHIFVSPALGPGVIWEPHVLQEIEEADLFVLLYLVDGEDMDWCLYEAGYFEREARKSGKNLVCMVKEGRTLPGPLQKRQRLELTSEGVGDLLRTIYKDATHPVWPDLFDQRQSKTLNELITFVHDGLTPVTKAPLSPRVWIELVGKDELKQLSNCILPFEARLSGEAEAFKQLGLRANDEITLADFRERSEFKSSLDCYKPHLANCMRRILKGYDDLWVIPPISLARGVKPKVLVPAYIEKFGNDRYKFEFLLYQAEPEFKAGAKSPFAVLCNLFFLASSFCIWIIEDWSDTFRNLQSLGPKANPDEIRTNVRKFKLALSMIALEALNREINAPQIVYNCFPSKEHKDKLRQILAPENGSRTVPYSNLSKDFLIFSDSRQMYSATGWNTRPP